MKISLSASLLVLMMGAAPTIAVDHSKYNHGRRLESPNDEGYYRVRVEYDSNQHQVTQALNSSPHCETLHELPIVNEIVVRADAECLTELENNPNVSTITADAKAYKMIMPETEEQKKMNEESRRLTDPEAFREHVRRQLTKVKNATVTDEHIEMVRQKKHRSLVQNTLYGVEMVNARDVWPQSDGTGVRVCVVDTGIDADHEDFNTGILTGYSGNLNGGLPWDQDGDSHGTHCSGTIAALDNTIGVYGVAPGAAIHTVRVFNNNANWVWQSNVDVAVQKCVDAGSRVVSMSLGSSQFINAEANYFDALKSTGVIAIAAAGNSGNSVKEYPASYEGVVSVAAVNSNGQRAGFSQYNDMVDIAAPGVNVRSTTPNNNYASYSGTSMATPHVAGVAALLLGKYSTATAAQVTDALIAGAGGPGSSGRDNFLGYGITDAKASMDYMDTLGLPVTGPGPNPGPATPAPAPGPATPAPAAVTTCSGSDVLMEIDVMTDSWGYETELEVTDSSGNVIVTRNGFPSSTLTSITECVDPSGCYEMNLVDTFSDGFFSGAYLDLKLDGTLVKQVTGSFSTVTEEFGTCNGGGGGGGGGGTNSCAAGENHIHVDLKTDMWGSETRIKIKQGSTLIENERGFADVTEYNLDFCIPAGVCHKVIVVDTASDGLCCIWGEGYAHVYSNDILIGSVTTSTRKNNVFKVDC